MKKNWIAVDWGSTNFRAFLMTQDGICVEEKSTGAGLLSIMNSDFSSTLRELLGKWVEKTTTIYMAGMIGSKQGWKEAPYISVPAISSDFMTSPVKVKTDWADCIKIVAGATNVNIHGLYDVMRGEEVQLIGLAKIAEEDNFSAILPGTHSKHAIWNGKTFASFSTFMTGELYSVLTKHSILGLNLPEQKPSNEVFLMGVDVGNSAPCTSMLFSARTKMLFDEIQGEHVHQYLSGLLIGAEISNLNQGMTHYIIGGENLSEEYAKALSHLNFKSKIVSGNSCFLKGMHELYLIDSGKS